MPISATELKAQLAQTDAFVKTRPETIVLTPYEYVADGSGGKKKTALPARDPQVVRFVEIVSSRSDRRLTEVGEQYSQMATIIAMPTVVMEPEDEFDWDGDTWHVQEIAFPNEWSLRATVLRYGR